MSSSQALTADVPAVAPPRRGVANRGLAALTWLSTGAAIAWLAFSYLLPQRLTDIGRVYGRLAAVAFYGRVFTFHVGLLLTVALVMAGVLRRRWLALTAALAAAVALWPTAAACLPRTVPSAVGRPVRILSMNVKYTNADPDDVIAEVRKADPDVLAIEEFGASSRRPLEAALTGDYPFRCVRADGNIGLGLYSRLPFEGGRPQVSFGGVRRQIRAVVRVGDRPVAVYVLHPLSPRTIRRVIYNRLFTADLVDQLHREPLPVVLAGDFNFTAETPNAAALTRPTDLALTDAFDLAGRGRGSTWPVRPRWAGWLPGVRIDHVYLAPGLTCPRYATGGYMGSDHLPIAVDVAVAGR
jgi:endonuclease/exonuclease/phosphatase (EEP) superfamily protein YafD